MEILTDKRSSVKKSSRIYVSVLICILLIFSSAISAFAGIDSRVSDSYTKTTVAGITASEARTHSNWTNTFLKARASGYITSSTYHYANSELFSLGQHVRYSGRKYGTGKVSTDTGWATETCAVVNFYGSAIWYGF